MGGRSIGLVRDDLLEDTATTNIMLVDGCFKTFPDEDIVVVTGCPPGAPSPV